jgi:hypothetical protein
MRRPGGYAHALDIEGRVVDECDTYTCAHCNSVVRVQPRTLIGGCRQCDALVCEPCAQRGSCTPFERRMERAEARAASRRSMGL